jgi:hypothetical protein
MTARTFSSIKTASRLVNGFAAAAIAFAPSLSFGQDLKPMPVASTSDGITATTNCKEWQPGELMASEKCEIIKGEFLRAQGKALSSQGSQVATQNGCIEAIVRFKKAEPDQFASLGLGTITRDNACKLASRLPKKSASLQ